MGQENCCPLATWQDGLKWRFGHGSYRTPRASLEESALSGLDPFDRVQLAEVVRVCRSSRTLSEAGRALFSASRTKKGSSNVADRLRKYLARFGLDWAQV